MINRECKHFTLFSIVKNDRCEHFTPFDLWSSAHEKQKNLPKNNTVLQWNAVKVD